MILLFFSYLILCVSIYNGNRLLFNHISLLQIVLAFFITSKFSEKYTLIVILLFIFQLGLNYLLKLKIESVFFSTQINKSSGVEYLATKVFYLFFLIILLIQFKPTGLFLFSENLEADRINFAIEKSFFLRIPKTIFPFLSILMLIFLYEKNFKLIRFCSTSLNALVLYFLFFYSFLFEGSKSGLLTGFIILTSFHLYYKFDNTLFQKLKIYIFALMLLFVVFIVYSMFFSNSNIDLEIANLFFESRFLNDYSKSITSPLNYVDQNGYYMNFIFGPFQIFFEKIFFYNPGSIFPSLGNFLESDYITPNSFEILVPNYLEGYVFFGLIGSIVWLLVNYILILYSFKKMIFNFKCQKFIDSTFWFMIFNEGLSIQTRGKFSNSITSVFLTLIFIFLILKISTLLTKTSFSNKINNIK